MFNYNEQKQTKNAFYYNRILKITITRKKYFFSSCLRLKKSRPKKKKTLKLIDTTRYKSQFPKRKTSH